MNRAGRSAQPLLLNATVVLTAGGAAALLFVPGRFHEAAEGSASILLLLGAIVFVWALRRATSARDELAARVRAHETVTDDLIRSDQRLELAQKAARVGTWDMDLVTRDLAWSASMRELMGVDGAVRATFERFIEFVQPEDREHVREAVEGATAHGDDFHFEFRFLRPDGAEGWMLSRGHAVLDGAGVPVRILGVGLDITERKAWETKRDNLEQQLRQAQRLEAVGRLAGGVAHDFNNLLLAVRGYAELAVMSLERGGDAHDEIGEIVTAADRAADLTGQLLAFSRQQVLQPELLDLNEVVAETKKLLGRLIGEDVELDVLAHANDVFVDADRSQLEQVIVNLAVNARDAMPDGGHLTIEVGTIDVGFEHDLDLPPGPFALLAVTDSGCGMTSEIAAQIFEPFFTTKPDGGGLGLATVHGLVKQSGGSVSVYSEIAHGSTFKVYLPLAAQAPRAKRPLPGPVPATATGETILLVEDDEQVRGILHRMLEARGYRVLAASAGEEALELADSADETIDLLLSDLVMPGLSGREVAEQLEAMQPDVLVLHMSGYTDDAVVRRGVLDRKASFIQKPFSSDELDLRIRGLLDSDRSASADRVLTV